MKTRLTLGLCLSGDRLSGVVSWNLLWVSHGLPCWAPVYRGCPCRDPPVCHRVLVTSCGLCVRVPRSSATENTYRNNKRTTGAEDTQNQHYQRVLTVVDNIYLTKLLWRFLASVPLPVTLRGGLKAHSSMKNFNTLTVLDHSCQDAAWHGQPSGEDHSTKSLST